MTRQRIVSAIVQFVAFGMWLWLASYVGYQFGMRHVCERAVEAGYATKTEASDGTHYHFKAVAK